jgi:uncharacterized protein YcbX
VHVRDLFIYPLSSGHALNVERFEALKSGPRHDRVWFATDEEGTERSQMQKAGQILANIHARPLAGGREFVFTAQGQDDLIVQRPNSNSDAGEMAGVWFSQALGSQSRLTYREPVQKNSDDLLGMSDAVLHKIPSLPLHITSARSLEAFNNSSSLDVNMNRFRPNIVIDGEHLIPFEEDTWKEIRIGTAILFCAIPQARCRITTVDQNNGNVPDPKQPLSALAKTRFGKTDSISGSFFGQRVLVIEPGTIKVGDKIEVISRKPHHPALSNVELGLDT